MQRRNSLQGCMKYLICNDTSTTETEYNSEAQSWRHVSIKKGLV